MAVSNTVVIVQLAPGQTEHQILEKVDDTLKSLANAIEHDPHLTRLEVLDYVHRIERLVALALKKTAP